MIRQWITELTRAVRALSRAPGFTAVTTVTLGLAIGANAAIFTVVDGVLLEPLPFENADELVAIGSSTPGNNTPPEFGVSPEFYLLYRDEAPSLQNIALYSDFGGTVRIEGIAERIRGAEVSLSFFETLGVTPLIGRLPTAAEVAESGMPSMRAESSADVVLISHSFWTQSFAADPSVIGTSVELNDRNRTIIGVMPPELSIPERGTAVWVPFEVDPDQVRPGQFRWNLVGRVGDGAEPDQLQAQLAQLAARLPEMYTSPGYVAFLVDGQYRPIVTSFKEDMVGDLEQPLWILFGTVGFVLLIACANVANLFLVRAESRQRDMAVRLAIGADRSNLIRSHLAEAFVLALLGGVLGAGLAWVGVPLLVRAAPDGIPRLDAVGLDAGVLGFTAALSLVSAMMFGLAAAIRYSSPKLLARLRFAGRGMIGRERQLARNALVVAQSGLGLVLLVGSGLLIRSFAELTNMDPGFDSDDVLTFQVALPFESYNSAEAMASFHVSMLERLSGLPGVESVGLVQELPLDEGASGTAFEFDQSTTGDDALPPITYYTYASPGYFETMGIDLQTGRTFVNADHENDRGHAIISRLVADRYWPGEDALGKRLRMGSGMDTAEGWETVVGVVDDVRDRDLREPGRGMVYLPLVGRDSEDWAVPSPAYTIKATNARGLIAAVRDEIRRSDPGLPVYRMQTMEEVVSESVVRLSFTMLALGVSAVMALILGAVGLYGVLSYLVAQRTQEIGVRLALGAEKSQVLRMVVGQGVKLAAAGMLVGVAGAAGLTRLLQGLLFGTEPLDPMTFAGMSAVMLCVGLVASYIPARRASAVDPIESMRME